MVSYFIFTLFLFNFRINFNRLILKIDFIANYPVQSLYLCKSISFTYNYNFSTHSSIREKMAHAYDDTLDKMGLHNQSYVFWVDYINFLKAVLVLLLEL